MNIVRSLRKLALQFNEVLIATDPDAEGERIAYDLTLALKSFNRNVQRAEFHEVTKFAFRRAIDSPRVLDQNLVEAQLARRVLDRWVGFELSSKLWRVFRRYDLSAGRVQTPVLGWIIERTIPFNQKKALLKLLVKDEKENTLWLTLEIEEPSIAKKISGQLLNKKLNVAECFEEIVQPSPLHNTATILSELGSRLGSSTVMDVLQELFEQGLITYHRTDSFTISETGVKLAEQIVSEKFSKDLFQPRRYRSAGAHECIRITKNLSPEELKLWFELGRVNLSNPKLAIAIYAVIFKKFIALQMKSVKVLKKKLLLPIDSNQHTWEIIDSVIEHGFNLVLPFRTQHVEKEPFIASTKTELVRSNCHSLKEASSKQMQERGLGRPSTYAKIAQNLLERGYVI